MTGFIVVDNNEIDLFVHEKVINYCGINKVTTFKNLADALDFLKENETVTNNIVMLVDLKIFFNHGKLVSETMERIKEIRKGIKIYFLSVMIQPTNSFLLSIDNSIKGFIQKPLTVEKVKMIMEY